MESKRLLLQTAMLMFLATASAFEWPYFLHSMGIIPRENHKNGDCPTEGKQCLSCNTTVVCSCTGDSCIPDQGTTTECPQNSYCDSSKETQNCELGAICRYKEFECPLPQTTEEVIYPDPYSCFTYHSCRNGDLYTYHCPVKTAFDPKTKGCSIDLDGPSCPSPPIKPCEKDGYTAAIADSDYIYVCKVDNGPPIVMYPEIRLKGDSTATPPVESTTSVNTKSTTIASPTTTTPPSTTTTPVSTTTTPSSTTTTPASTTTTPSSTTTTPASTTTTPSSTTTTPASTTTTPSSTTTTPASTTTPPSSTTTNPASTTTTPSSTTTTPASTTTTPSSTTTTPASTTTAPSSTTTTPASTTTTPSSTTTTTVIPTSTTLQPCPDGPGSYADENDCKSFYVCYEDSTGNLKWVHETCRSGSHYDATQKKCVKGDCVNNVTTTTVIPGTTPKPVCTSAGSFANSTCCQCYYVCYADGSGFGIQSFCCRKGSIFDSKLLKCVRGLKCTPCDTCKDLCPTVRLDITHDEVSEKHESLDLTEEHMYNAHG